jgi:hypothetical protein
LVRARPTLFGYQHILRLTPHAEETIQAAALVEAEDDLPYAARA